MRSRIGSESTKFLRRFTARENEKKAVSHKDPEENFEDWPEAGRTDRARIQPRHDEEYQIDAAMANTPSSLFGMDFRMA